MSARFPPPPPLPKKAGLFRQVPPAVFPPILGLFGLGIAWRRGLDSFGLPPAVIELFLGGVTLLFVFAAACYAIKFALRPGVVAEDLGVLPGRAGLAALTMCVMMLAAVLLPYAPGTARLLLFGGLAAHLALALFVLVRLLGGPAEARQITPAMHLTFVGVIVAPIAAVPLGYPGLATAIVWYALAVALAVWAGSIAPLLTGRAPPPLRPLQAIHLAPAALVATGAFLTGQGMLGLVMTGAALGVFAVLLLRARWLTEAGFSGFWSAFTFPVAALAGALFLASAQGGGEAARIGGGLVLVFATLIIPPIAVRVMQLWAKGALAAKTNAAVA